MIHVLSSRDNHRSPRCCRGRSTPQPNAWGTRCIVVAEIEGLRDTTTTVPVDCPADSHDSAWDTTESVSEAKLKYRYAELVSMADGTPRNSSCSQSNNDTLSAGYPPGPFARRFSRIRQRQGACARPSQKRNKGYIRVRSCKIHTRNAPRYNSPTLIPIVPLSLPTLPRPALNP